MLHTAVSGLRNSVTADPVTLDTVMHIGSITKVLNAALMMQLVDEGRIRLEDPVEVHLPLLRLRDSHALQHITCAMLVNHTSGINCSMLSGQGPDKERIEDAITRCAGLGQIFTPGEATSYCNIATVIAGYLTQTLRRESWYNVIKSRILLPLEMRHALVDLAELPRFRCSIGDLTDPATGKRTQTTRPYLPLSFAPAGTTAMMTASDLVTFGRSMISGGVGLNGVRILSQSSTTLMATATASLVLPVGWKVGLGWMIRPDGILTHGGGGPGIYSTLYAHPLSGRVMALLCNSDNGAGLDSVFAETLLQQWIGVAQVAKAERRGTVTDSACYEGVYELNPFRAEVRREDGRLTLRFSVTERLYDNMVLPNEVAAIPLKPLSGDCFEVEGMMLRPGKTEVRFVPGRDGRMRFFAPFKAHLLARVE